MSGHLFNPAWIAYKDGGKGMGMRHAGTMLLSLAVAAPAWAGPLELLPGTYANEEDVYFAAEAEKPPPPYAAIRITREGAALRFVAIDKFGRPTGDGHLMTVDGDTLVAADCRMPFRAEGAPRWSRCRASALAATGR